MSKVLDIFRIAEAASARENGINLEDIKQILQIETRSAQRIVHLLELAFPTIEKRKDPDRTRWWKLHFEPLLCNQGIRDSELASLQTTIMRARQHGSPLEVQHLESIRDRMLASIAPIEARKLRNYAEAALEARGHAFRPGPRVRPAPELLENIEEALKAGLHLQMNYVGAQDENAKTRLVQPYGLLFGVRAYLVAHDPSKDQRFRHFRLDRILSIDVTEMPFQKDPAFDLSAHAAQAFGSFINEQEYGPIAWKFSPDVAEIAREFEFHPMQVFETTDDGALIVRFEASGWLEMIWHLYKWGDAVTVLEPPALAELVAAHRRGDFPARP